MMFEVHFTHDDDKVQGIIFEGAEFDANSDGKVAIWLGDEAGMNWYRLKQAVEQEEAAESGDYDMRPFKEER